MPACMTWYTIPYLYGAALATYIAVAGILWALHRLNRDDLLLPVGAMNYMMLLTVSQYMAMGVGLVIGSLG